MTSKEYIPQYDLDPDGAITAARNDYVFFGKKLDDIHVLYAIPKELLGECAFVGKDCWRDLRAKVEEDELDGLINTNLYTLKKSLNAAISKVYEFLDTAEAALEDWDEVDKVMKVISGLTKAAEVSKKLQEHRLPNKAKRIAAKKGEMPLLLDNDEESDDREDFEDEYSKPDKNQLTEAREREDLSKELDNLV